MKKFIITQLHTFEYVYEIEAKNEEEALFLLQTESHDPISEEFHSMNDSSDWTIDVDE